jgi:hypothetical protein
VNPFDNDWPIKHRAETCARTQRPFQPGEQFYTLLFRAGDGFRREDISEEAWAARNENIRPFSFWKTRYEPAPPATPEPLESESAEDILRRLLQVNDASQANACYVLAIMLERKRVLKQIKTDQTGARPVLIYEHVKSGDVFIVPDARLKLDEIEHVQREVSELLNKNVS